MDPSEMTSEQYEEWYDSLRKPETGGTSVTLDDIRARRTEILELADRYGVTNVRLRGQILHGPVEPGAEVQFLVDFESGNGGLGFFAFAGELVKMLSHYVDVTRSTAPDLNGETFEPSGADAEVAPL